MSQHYKMLQESHTHCSRCFQEERLIQQDSLCKLTIQSLNIYQQGMFLSKLKFVIHSLRPRFLLDSQCKKMHQLMHTFQGHRCRYKMHLSIQLLIPTFLLGNQCM